VKTEINPTTDSTFEAEARRLGRVLSRRQWQIGLQAVGIGFSSIALVLGCLFVALLHNLYLLVGVFAGAIAAIIVGMLVWDSPTNKTVKRLLAVTCPLCGGAARFETSSLPDIQIYLACPQCNQRADTGFKVPFNRRVGGRYAMGYNWETRKMGRLMMVRVGGRRRAKKQDA